MKKTGLMATSAIAALSTLALGIPASMAATPDVKVQKAHTTAAKATTGTSDVSVTRNASGSYSVTWHGAGPHRVYASTRATNPSSHGTLVGSSKWGSLTVKGLNDWARWYFEVVSPTAERAAVVRKKVRKGGKTVTVKKLKDVRGVIVSSRGLGLDSVSNTRDLGGIQTVDGRSIRWGKLFRSEAVTAPSARDQAVLATMGLRHSIEFRSEAEIAKNGTSKYPASVIPHPVALLDASTDALSVAIQGALRSNDPAVVKNLLGDGKAEKIARDGIVDLVLSQPAREGFAQGLRLLSTKQGAPLIFNCTAGKDRTGAFAAIAERLLGVSERDAVTDYELSNVYRKASTEATYTRLAAIGVDRALLQPLLEQDGDNLTSMFRAIDEAYGSFDRFLTRGLGLDTATIKQIQANLLV